MPQTTKVLQTVHLKEICQQVYAALSETRIPVRYYSLFLAVVCIKSVFICCRARTLVLSVMCLCSIVGIHELPSPLTALAYTVHRQRVVGQRLVNGERVRTLPRSAADKHYENFMKKCDTVAIRVSITILCCRQTGEHKSRDRFPLTLRDRFSANIWGRVLFFRFLRFFCFKKKKKIHTRKKRSKKSGVFTKMLYAKPP